MSEKENPKVRFHSVFTGEGDTRRILATVAALEIGRNEKAERIFQVGISRANTDLEEKPTEFGGKRRAEARVQRAIQLSLHKAGVFEMPATKAHRTEGEQRRNLSLVMTEVDFYEKIVNAEPSPFLAGEECPYGGKDTMFRKLTKKKRQILGSTKVRPELSSVPRTQLPKVNLEETPDNADYVAARARHLAQQGQKQETNKGVERATLGKGPAATTTVAVVKPEFATQAATVPVRA